MTVQNKVITAIGSLSLIATALSSFFIWVSNRWIDSIETSVKTNTSSIVQISRDQAVDRANEQNILNRLERIDNKLDVLINAERGNYHYGSK